MSFYDVAPPSVQAIIQNGLLDRSFGDALVAKFLFDQIAEERPWEAGVGSQSVMTRAGLMAPQDTPVTGNDAPVGDYGFERYSVKMEQYGLSKDTNMAVSAQALASLFLQDNKTLAINAAQSLNRVARKRLYGAYAGGRTWVTVAAAAASATATVNDVNGFASVAVNVANANAQNVGMNVVPVSAANPLPITINGVANTVIGVNTTNNTLTLGTAVVQGLGDAVVSLQAPVSYRPNAKTTAYNLAGADIATLAVFQNAVTRLALMNVPPIDANGNYVAFVSPQTSQELWQDPAFRQAYQGRGDSQVYQSGSIGTILGIDFVINNELPTLNVNNNTVYRSIVCGDEVLVKAPFSAMGNLLQQNMAPTGNTTVQVVNGIVRIWRGPTDRLGQTLSSTWSWIGDYAAPTDMLTGDAALFKRAVMVEHV